jgi:hemolysin III
MQDVARSASLAPHAPGSSRPRLRGWLHAAAGAATLAAGPLLALRADWSALDLTAVAIYVTGLLGSFAVSAAYHLAPVGPTARKHLQRADHVAIFACIAGCYVPLCLVALPGTLGDVLLSVAGAGALGGMSIKLAGAPRARRIASAGYLVVGWVGVVAMARLASSFSPPELALLCATGVGYTAGSAVLATHWPDPAPTTFGYHEVWHLAGTLAAASYFILVWLMVAPHA